jgi:hypothetical protein
MELEQNVFSISGCEESMSELVGLSIVAAIVAGVALGLLLNIWLELKAIRRTLHEHAEARRHAEQRRSP